MKYGLPYQGSKNKLAKRIVDLLPPAEHLYDVFAGGCAVSHAALLSGKFGCVHFSDTNDVVTLFRDALEGDIPDGSEWISHEEFFKRKDTDPYVRVVWSFGNNQKTYLYRREIEPYKKAAHEMIFAPTPNERRLKFGKVFRLIPLILNNISRGDQIESAERSQRLLSIDRLQSAEIENGLNLPFCGGEYEMKVADYRDIDILPNSVIYADPPYAGTIGYIRQDFDHAAFYDWCERQTQPLFISEYWMPEDRFESVAEFEKRCTFSPTNKRKKEIERIYRPKKQLYEQV